jgi:hypothetical protein
MITHRSYLSGCSWCNATGFVSNLHMGWVTDTTIICPVCQGSKTVWVNEIIEDENKGNWININPPRTKLQDD